MCGIAGIIQPHADSGIHREKIQKMMSAISHRGPDGQGFIELSGGITLGHVRLAILDLSTSADQPMQSYSGRSTIVYNGELYNHNALRMELLKNGFGFKTRSDTEVILNAYECFGDGFIHKLNGMFAFVIHDAESGTLTFARDRLGIKPLYYYSDGDQIVFSSEIKGVAAGLNHRLGLNPESLLEYLVFQNNYGENTLVKDVKLFPAGAMAKLSANETCIRPKRYWEASIVTTNQTHREREEELASLLDSVMDSQLEADVAVNAFLSGGIDSSAIASLATKKTGRIKTFTCGFDLSNVTEAELAFDERSRAELISATLGSEHYAVTLKDDDFLANMRKWAWHAEEPRVGTSFPNYSVSYLASRFTKICLSGTGADELFGGYPWRYQAALQATSNEGFIASYFQSWNRMLSANHYHSLVAPLHRDTSFDAFESFTSQMHRKLLCASESAHPRADAALLFEMETFLQGLLIMEDKASMAHGLEVRVPFIDNRLIDMALTIPFHEKVQTENDKGSACIYGKGSTKMPAFMNGKVILRNLLANYLPNEITRNRKQGFSPPIETWFRQKMRPWLQDEVLSDHSPLAEFLDMRIARTLWMEHLNHTTNHRLFLWGIVALHLFMTEFLRKLP